MKKKLLNGKKIKMSQLFGAAIAMLMLGGCKSYHVQTSAEYPPPCIPKVCSVESVSMLPDSIQPGDMLELFVREDSSFNGKYHVREGGDIIIPSVGRIDLQGTDMVQASKRVEHALENSQLHEANVIVDRVGRPTTSGKCEKKPSPLLKIYMTGKVSRPGQHSIPLPEKGWLGVHETILLTGGLNKFAHREKVHIIRTDCDGVRHCIPVNIKAIESCCCDDIRIGDGDIVVVPEKIFGF